MPLALRQFELLVDQSPDFIGFIDLTGKILFGNAAALRLLGLSAEEIQASNIVDHVAPEQRAQVREEILPDGLREGQWLGDLTLQNAETSTTIPVFCRVFRVDDPTNGQPESFAIFAQDQTKQKRKENELHDAQQSVSSVLAAGEVGTWTFEVASQLVVADANLCRIFGLSFAEHYQAHIGEFLRRIHPEDLSSVEAAIASAIASGPSYLAEYRIVRKDGSIRFVIARGMVERDDAGNALQLPGVVLDITDRVRAQNEQLKLSAELERSEERLRVSLDAGQIGAWDLNLVTGEAWRSLQHDQTFGYQELLPDWTYEMFLEHVVPEDRARVDAAFQAALAGVDIWEVECQIRRADGELRWIAPRARVSTRDENGQATRMLGVVIDITALKKAEGELRESESRFRQLADTIPQLAWMADAEGSIFWYNHRWYDYTGTAAADMEGWGWQSVHDPKELPHVLERWKASITNGEPFDMTFPLRAANGEFRRFLTRVMPFRDEKGRLSLWFGTNTDVEDQRRTAETMRDQSEQLSLALEAGQLGTWQLDLATMELTASEACRENSGLEADAPFTYSTLWEMMHPEDRAPTRAAVQRAIDENRSYAAEYRVVWPDASVHWIAARGRPIEREGKLRLLVGITQEITDSKFAEEQREQYLAEERAARAEAERVGRMKDEFLATLSHELRTPLNAIFGWTQLMKGGGLETKLLAEGIDVIDRNVRAQTRLIEDLLDMSRVISGKLRLDVQHLDPSQAIDAAVETVRPAAEAKGIRIEKILDPQAGPISGDPNRIQQIFWNLLSNAIKFTARGGKVQVLLERVNSHLEITVADTGQGISPEFLPYVFDRFRQADAAANRRHGGLGLGLAIAKQLVELHGGSIRVESKGPGKGTAFIVSLPLQVMQARMRRTDRRHPLATTQTPVFEKCTDLAGLKVLVVDDEQDARELLRIMLQNCEAEVVTAASAEEALPLVEEHAPDVLVSDIGMAGVDGYEPLRKIRANAPRKGRKMPAIALTAFARSEDRTKALLSGFSAHISKPVEPAELIATIVSVVDRPRKGDGQNGPSDR